MGTEVARVPRGARVESTGAGEDFARWFAQERALRGVSLEYVATRTKLTLQRVRSIEDGSAALTRDGAGRAAARALARAIGADPGEAAARLANSVPPRGAVERPPPTGIERRWRIALEIGALGLALLLAGWALTRWLDSKPDARARPALVEHPDYIERLLDEREP